MRAVAHHRTGECAAKSTLVERGLVARKGIARVEPVVAAEVETAPRKPVRARSSRSPPHSVRGRTGRQTGFGTP